MPIISERLEKSYQVREKILESLKEKPMTYSQIREHFNLTKPTTSNHILSLTRAGLIKYDDKDMNQKRTDRHYIATPGMLPFREHMEMVRKHATSIREHWAGKLKLFAENASMKVSADQYHTRGNNVKQSAWSGYGGYFDN